MKQAAGSGRRTARWAVRPQCLTAVAAAAAGAATMEQGEQQQQQQPPRGDEPRLRGINSGTHFLFCGGRIVVGACGCLCCCREAVDRRGRPCRALPPAAYPRAAAPSCV